MDQLTIIIEDSVGMLATVLDLLAKNKINVNGLSTERGPISEIRLMVDNPVQAQEILENAGWISHVVDIVVLRLKDTPGELARITKMISDNSTSIDYIYGFGLDDEGYGLVAIKSELEATQLRDILKDFTTY